MAKTTLIVEKAELVISIDWLIWRKKLY